MQFKNPNSLGLASLYKPAFVDLFRFISSRSCSTLWLACEICSPPIHHGACGPGHRVWCLVTLSRSCLLTLPAPLGSVLVHAWEDSPAPTFLQSWFLSARCSFQLIPFRDLQEHLSLRSYKLLWYTVLFCFSCSAFVLLLYMLVPSTVPGKE